MSGFRTSAAVSVIFAAACMSSDRSASTDSAVSSPAVTPPVATSPESLQVTAIPESAAAESTTSSSLPDTAKAKSWTVNLHGVGPVTAGMTVGEASAASGNAFAFPAKLSECDYVRTRSKPAGVAVMVEHGRISRVDVDRGTVATAEGARIGDTEQRIKSLYAGRVQVQPHKYTDGHYLVVTPTNPADSAYRLIFETDGAKVTRYRSGKRPAVEYVETCS